MEDRVITPMASGWTASGRTTLGQLSPRVALVIVSAALVGIVLYAGRSSLGPFIVGLVLAYLLDIPVERLSTLTLRVFGQWLKGQLFLGITVGVATFIGLIILSVTVDPVFGRFAIFLSVIAGVFELLPIIGPILSAIPAILLALTAGTQPALAALLLYLIIQQVENNLLVPKIQGDAVELHPTIVMVALVVGGSIGGLLGAILALPITAAARDVFRYIFHRVDVVPASPDAALAMVRDHPAIVAPDDWLLADPDPALAVERKPEPGRSPDESANSERP